MLMERMRKQQVETFLRGQRRELTAYVDAPVTIAKGLACGDF
jgi:hypothetical protein